MPRSKQQSTMAAASASEVWPPKVMAPKQARETVRPVWASVRVSMETTVYRNRGTVNMSNNLWHRHGRADSSELPYCRGTGRGRYGDRLQGAGHPAGSFPGA